MFETFKETLSRRWSFSKLKREIVLFVLKKKFSNGLLEVNNLSVFISIVSSFSFFAFAALRLFIPSLSHSDMAVKNRKTNFKTTKWKYSFQFQFCMIVLFSWPLSYYSTTIYFLPNESFSSNLFSFIFWQWKFTFLRLIHYCRPSVFLASISISLFLLFTLYNPAPLPLSRQVWFWSCCNFSFKVFSHFSRKLVWE